ncbi:putative reverse transcriptase domain-containing protein [Tanacetum coccineum]
MDACDQVHSEGMSLWTTVMAQQSEITELQAADREELRLRLIELQRQQGPAKDPAEPEYQENATKRKAHKNHEEVKASHRGTPPPVTTTPPPVTDPTTTTSVTNAQLQAMIDEGVTAVLAARATTRNGDDSHTSRTGARRNERSVRECTYQDFMKCQPLFFRGTEGAVNLTQWFERMEIVFLISNCTVENQVKFARCSLKKLIKLKDMLVGCPTSLLSVVASKPKTMQEAIEMATELMDRRNKLLLRDRQGETRGSLKTLLEITKPNNQTKGKTQAGLMLPGTVTGNPIRGLNLDVPSVTSTITVLVHQNALTAGSFGHLVQGPVEPCEAPGHFRNNLPPVEHKNQGNGSGVFAVARALCSGIAEAKPQDNNIVRNNIVLEMGTYDVIIGMDWLDDEYQAVIDCGYRKSFFAFVDLCCCKDDTVFLALVPIRETGDKSKKSQLQACTSSKIFRSISRGLARSSQLPDKWRISPSFSTRTSQVAEEHLKDNIGVVEKEELKQRSVIEAESCVVPQVWPLPEEKQFRSVRSDDLEGSYLSLVPKCTVFTDHKSLQHILNQKELNMRQRHWLELLSDYDCDIHYHPGRQMSLLMLFEQEERNHV